MCASLLYRCVSSLLLLFLFVTFFSGNVRAADVMPDSIKIIIVDINNQAFDAEIVRWWYSGKRNNKYELECLNGQCNERFLNKALAGPIVISADTSVVVPEDMACWQLYHGEALLDTPTEEVKIVIHYKNKICK